MTTVNTTTSTTPAAAGTALSGLTSASDQQDRFMKLLVAQMQNQDPLNPMDNSQMTSQIAQINTVGGLEKLNGTVESLLAAFSAMQGQSALQLAGRDVLVAGDQLALAGGSARGGVEFTSAAPGASVQILAADGSVLRTVPLGANAAGVRSFDWDGRDNQGNAVADGSYQFRVVSAGAALTGANPLVAAHVDAISPNNGQPLLDLGALGSVPLADVRSYL